MRTATDPGEQQYLEFIQAQVIPWEKETRLSLQQAIKNLEPKLAAHGIQLKSPVNLIHTTGKEESGAAYTRGNEIIFTKRIFDPLKPPTKLLAHELFHVISGNTHFFGTSFTRSSDLKKRTQSSCLITLHTCGLPIRMLQSSNTS